MVSSNNASVFAVDSKGRETLADYVRRIRLEKRLSLTDVKRQSHGLISDAYVSRIENGHSANVSPRMLRALAAGLRVPEDEVFARARGLDVSEPSAEENTLLGVFRQLPAARRKDLMRIAEMFGREHGARPAQVKVTEQKRRKPPKAA